MIIKIAIKSSNKNLSNRKGEFTATNDTQN